MGTTEVKTDAGPAYLKALGNRQGPHALACEWVATQLAKWFGLPTFDAAILRLEPSDEFPLPRGARARAGPAFVTRAVPGQPWGRSEGELDQLSNPQDISRLVVFDTWTQNCDRFPPNLEARKPNYDNVFIEEQTDGQRRPRLVAMDHTHCFTCGRDLTPRLADIGTIQDDRLYGLFPQFVTRMIRREVDACSQRLRTYPRGHAARLMEQLPSEWEVREDVKAAWVDLISRRASFVADNIVTWLTPRCWASGTQPESES